MGRSKPLLPLGPKPAIRRCLDSILASGIRNIVVVVGARGAEIADALRGLPVNIVRNTRPKSEMADSVRSGLSALDVPSSGVLVCLSDHPLVSTKTLKAIVRVHLEDPEKIIIPVYNGRRGHPSLFPRSVIDEIFSSATLKDVVNKDQGRVRCVDVADEGVVLDMDTEEDYRDLMKKIGEE